MTPRAPARRITGAVLVGAVALALAACRPIAPKPAPPAPPPTTAPAPTTTTAPPATTTTTAPPVPGCGASVQGAGASAAGADAATAAADGRAVVALVRRQGRMHVERHIAGSAAGAPTLARQLRSQSGVVAADVDQPVHVQTAGPDQYRSAQWALDRIPYEATWTATPGGDGTGVTVAVLDTGVNRAHEDLDDGRVLAGCDFSDPYGGDGGNDQNGHGTFVAGIIGAIPDNGVGISGAAPGARILPVRVLDAQGNGWYSQIVDGITWATDAGANVINLSLAGTADLSILHDAVQYAVDHGVTVVMAAGNCRVGGTLMCGSSDNPTMYPAEYADTIPGAIAVGATAEDDTIAPFSTYGSYVKLVAPGVDIASTWGEGDTTYGEDSGTSFAAPYAAAAAAILRGACPADTPAQLEARLQATAQDLGPPGSDPDFGAGLVRPDLAVAAC